MHVPYRVGQQVSSSFSCDFSSHGSSNVFKPVDPISRGERFFLFSSFLVLLARLSIFVVDRLFRLRPEQINDEKEKGGGMRRKAQGWEGFVVVAYRKEGGGVFYYVLFISRAGVCEQERTSTTCACRVLLVRSFF